MLEISHQNAHILLQAAADRRLSSEEKSALDAHLAGCQECNLYAKGITALEAGLRRVTHKQWDDQQPNLDFEAIIKPPPVKQLWRNTLNLTHATGKLTVVAALLLGYIVIVNLLGSQSPTAQEETPITIPTPSQPAATFALSPTPFTQSTLTELTSQACETIVYVVQTNDTLASVALRHGISVESILGYNKENDFLLSNTVFTGMELTIPLCKSTPSQTATTTITPVSWLLPPTHSE